LAQRRHGIPAVTLYAGKKLSKIVHEIFFWRTLKGKPVLIAELVIPHPVEKIFGGNP
jgi:hypothetical protein